jgi:hypothetical protein
VSGGPPIGSRVDLMVYIRIDRIVFEGRARYTALAQPPAS